MNNYWQINTVEFDKTSREGNTDNTGYGQIAILLSKYVRKEDGKGLSTNDFTDENLDKLNSVEKGSQVNKLETLTINNGDKIHPNDEKNINIDIPTTISQLENDSGYALLKNHSILDDYDDSYVGKSEIAIKNLNGTNLNELDVVMNKIPSESSSTNKLADKDYVNKAISTNTSNFLGTYSSMEDIEAIKNPTNNDYAFFETTDEDNDVIYKRYKYNTNKQEWMFEYDINNTNFNNQQWDAINSGMTSSDKTKLNNLNSTNIPVSDLDSKSVKEYIDDVTNFVYEIPSPNDTNKYYKITNEDFSKCNLIINNENGGTYVFYGDETNTKVYKLSSSTYGLKSVKIYTESSKGNILIKIADYNSYTLSRIDNSKYTVKEITQSDYESITSSTSGVSEYTEYASVSDIPLNINSDILYDSLKKDINVDWSSYSYLSNDTHKGIYTDKYKALNNDGAVVNIQNSNNKPAIYFTFDIPVISCDITLDDSGYSISGEGVWVYLDNFTRQETSFTITLNDNSVHECYVYYVDGYIEDTKFIGEYEEKTLTNKYLRQEVPSSINYTEYVNNELDSQYSDLTNRFMYKVIYGDLVEGTSIKFSLSTYNSYQYLIITITGHSNWDIPLMLFINGSGCRLEKKSSSWLINTSNPKQMLIPINEVRSHFFGNEIIINLVQGATSLGSVAIKDIQKYNIKSTYVPYKDYQNNFMSVVEELNNYVTTNRVKDCYGGELFDKSTTIEDALKYIQTPKKIGIQIKGQNEWNNDPQTNNDKNVIRAYLSKKMGVIFEDDKNTGWVPIQGTDSNGHVLLAISLNRNWKSSSVKADGLSDLAILSGGNISHKYLFNSGNFWLSLFN